MILKVKELMTKIYNNLPIFYLDVDETVEGVSIVSIVDMPAIERDFLTFSKEENVKFSFDNEKHILTGPALIPDLPIYRRNEGKEYYVTFTKEAIVRIVEKFFKDFNATNVNLEHSDLTNDCIIFESYLLDRERNIVPVEFEDLPDGTWLISMKVNSNTLWDEIKDGKYNGFSVEGILKVNEEPTKDYDNFSKVKGFDTLDELLDYIMTD